MTEKRQIRRLRRNDYNDKKAAEEEKEVISSEAGKGKQENTVTIFIRKIEKIAFLIIEKNCSRDDAIILSGLTKHEYNNHYKKKRNKSMVEDRLRKAEAERDTNLLKKALDGDQSARWCLERLSPGKWSRPSIQERLEKEEDTDKEDNTIDYDDDEEFIANFFKD